MSIHVSSLDVWTEAIRSAVRERLPAGYAIRFASSYDPAEQAALVAEADIVLAGWAGVTGAMMRAAPRLRMIQKWGIGVDRIDLDAARELGITVAITAGGNAHPVAEHAIMLMLAVYRRLSLVDRAMREGRWLFAEMREQCFQIREKTVGLVGFGHIGRAVARKLAGFEATIVYADPVPAPGQVERALGATRVPLDTLLARSDIVSLHLPGGGANRHLIDAAALARMKTGAVLINTARGDIVDETALAEALRGGHLMGAGLDVYDPEPPETGAALVGLDQVVVTPHTAGSVLDNVGNVARHAFGNMERLLRGEALAPADLVVGPEHPRSVAGAAAMTPVPANPAKARMVADALALGLIVRVARAPDIARIARATGHDFLFIDGQHALFSAETVGALIAASHASGIAPMVRVRGCDDPDIALWLDAGATGIIVPDVNDADEARRAARAAKFAPTGRRSLPGPMTLLDFRPVAADEAARRVDDATLLICMVETRQGLENCEAIAAVEGVDVVHVGGVDLRGDLGVADGSPEIVAATLRVIAAARAQGKFAGVGGDRDPTRLARYIERGARFLTTQVDISLLMMAGAEVVGTLRSLRPEK